MKKIFRYIRFKDWWAFIIPPSLSFYYIGLLCLNTRQTDIPAILKNTAFFVMLTFFTAAFGSYLNEWTDIEDDRLSHKSNALQELGNFKRCLLFLFLCAGIAAACINIPWKTLTLTLYAVQISLFILYSVPPFRLKRKKYAAVVLDALYSGTLFYCIAYLSASDTLPFTMYRVLGIFTWSFMRGVRNILLHLIKDRVHDVLLPFGTIASAGNSLHLKKKIFSILLPVEFMLYLIMLYLLPYNWIFITLFIFFLLYLFKRKEYILPFVVRRPVPIERELLTDVNLFYEMIFPVAAVSLLVYQDKRMIVVLLCTLLFFPQILWWTARMATTFIRMVKLKISPDEQ